MEVESARGRDLQKRISILLTQICNVQRLKCTKPIPAIAEFVVGFLEGGDDDGSENPANQLDQPEV